MRWTNGNCDNSGITGTSTTLGPLSAGATYIIWVRAVSPGRKGQRSNSVQENTCNGRLIVCIVWCNLQMTESFDVKDP